MTNTKPITSVDNVAVYVFTVYVVNLLVACCHGVVELRDTKPDQQLTQVQQSMVEDYDED